ncbi:ankyrin, partial [Zopfia rhizophila CBS 207.26]
HEQVVKLLLDKGADLESKHNGYGQDGNAIQAAAERGHKQVVKLLLDKGADLNATRQRGGEYGNAIQAASYGGHKQVVKLLLDKDADVNAQGGLYGNALCAAIPKCSTAIVRMLLKNGANSEMMDRHGWTASMIASKSDHQELHDAFWSSEHGLQWNGSQCLAPTTLITATENSTITIAMDGKTVVAGPYILVENLSSILTVI